MNTGILTKYRDGLAGLAGAVGQRNGRLLGLVSLGIMAGLGDECIVAEVRGASGNPPLGDQEIRHALQTAHKDTRPIPEMRTATHWKPPPKPRPPLGARASSFVARMIEIGASSSSLPFSERSPFKIPVEPREQARAFLSALYADGDRLFIGDKFDNGIPGANIRTTTAWLKAFISEPLSPLLMANPLSGVEGLTKEGKSSFRCGSCVASFKFALVEFDAMPLTEQENFWTGVLDTGTLPVRALTFSGNKSIHALVEIGASNASTWQTVLDTLLFAVCNPNAEPKHQADRACRNADRLMRLPGALRRDNGREQSLLWLSAQAMPARPVSAQPERLITVPAKVDAPCATMARCRDCWNWMPDGTKHGCAAGVKGRITPNWRGACAGFDKVSDPSGMDLITVGEGGDETFVF